MMAHCAFRIAGTVAVFMLAASAAAQGNSPGPQHWVGAWATAPQQIFSNDAANYLALSDTTIRQFVQPTLSGSVVRVRVTNALGSSSLHVDSATIGVRAGLPSEANATEMVAGSIKKLTFNGRSDIVIPAGATFFSDAIPFKLEAFRDVVLSLHVPQFTGIETGHIRAMATSQVLPGDQTMVEKIATAGAPTLCTYFIAGIDTLGDARTGAMIAIGDSITNGTASTTDKNARYPNLLAKRFADAYGKTINARISLLNMGISGNRILRDGAGPNLFSRLERDVLTQAGVRYVVLLEGINDISTGSPGKPGNEVTLQDLTGAYLQVADRVHSMGMRLIVGTITPVGLSGAYCDACEKTRLAVNAWIRSSKALDGVLDFDAAIRDPEHPVRIRAEYSSVDHIHPGDAGYEAMAETLDIPRFIGAYQPADLIKK